MRVGRGGRNGEGGGMGEGVKNPKLDHTKGKAEHAVCAVFARHFN